jgi:hypothetical protein
MQTRAARAAFFAIRATLGIVDRKGHLVRHHPNSAHLPEAMTKIGLRVGLVANHFVFKNLIITRCR